MVAELAEAPRPGRAAQERLEAEAHHHLRRLGRRGAGPARLDRVGRDPRRRAAPARRRSTSTPTATRAASSAPAARTSLETLVNQVARDVPDPEKGISVLDRTLAGTILFGPARPGAGGAADRGPSRSTPWARARTSPPSCSTWGSPRSTSATAARRSTAQYHSIYDSFDHFTRFVDPTFVYGVALAKTGGRLVMRLADADVLPFDFDRFTTTVGRYADEVQKLAGTLRKEAEDRNRGSRRQALPGGRRSDPDLGRPEAAGPCALPQLLAAGERGGGPQDQRRRLLQGDGAPRPPAARLRAPEVQQRLDDILMKTERALTTTAGPAAPPLVRPPDLRSRLLHRLRREDPPRRARGPRAAGLEGGGAADERGGRRDHGLRQGSSTGPRRCWGAGGWRRGGRTCLNPGILWDGAARPSNPHPRSLSTPWRGRARDRR